MIISNEVYNCLVNQAIAMKLESKEDSDYIAHKVVEEYFRNDEFSTDEKNEFIAKIRHILRD